MFSFAATAGHLATDDRKTFRAKIVMVRGENLVHYFSPELYDDEEAANEASTRILNAVLRAFPADWIAKPQV